MSGYTQDSQATVNPQEKFRKDYKQPNYWVREVQLNVRIFDNDTKVEAMLKCELNTAFAQPGAELVLDGEDLKLNSVEIDGKALSEGADGYKLSKDGMIIYGMEAEGFRRFTYFPDRPDVMSMYTRVRVEANRAKCPVLLSNGMEIEAGACADDSARHFAVFKDPFAKPCYLFAIVAGDLGCIKDKFTTASGREVQLGVFSEHTNVDQLGHAMVSLKKAMTWDEERFGLEYDLDVYSIVAVNDFNMGAMENKGLNVFNTSLTLAKPDTATDADYERIESVIGHEYFHNWTGNRVTCRDWFQLTLKEGLTVFRDQEFSAAMGSAAVKRIEDVRVLRASQFPEDSGPMAHPIRPESYVAMDNFYTATVYEKGAEVIRMYQTLLGRDGFRKGMDLYFERHDGTAVSCDDFRAAMADSSGRDLAQFQEWYLQPGTPQVEVKSSWDASAGRYTLTLKQLIGAGQKHLAEEKRREKPMLIPVVVGLLDKNSRKEVVPNRVLELTEPEQSFDFEGLSSEPVPSLLRNFSAPIKLDYTYTDEDLAFVAAHDTDSFNRWEAIQTLGSKVVKDQYAAGEGAECKLSLGFQEALGRILNDRDTKDLALLAFALILPTESTILESMAPPIDPVRLHNARGAVRRAIAAAFMYDFEKRYVELSPVPGEELVIDGPNAGRRSLRNVCLGYLAVAKDAKAAAMCGTQFQQASKAGCMTDKLAALQNLVDMPETSETADAIQKFYDDAKGDFNVINKWFAIQAMAATEDSLCRVEKLMTHSDFTMKNPNRLRSVVSRFALNPVGFHKADGSGYAFMAKMVLEVDKINPQVASRMASVFSTWAKLDEARQALIKEQLAMLKDREADLSKDTFEIVSTISKAA